MITQLELWRALRIACRARGPTLIYGVVTHHFRQYSQAAVAHMFGTLSRLAEIQHHLAHIYSYSQARSVNACSARESICAAPCSSSNICKLQRTTCKLQMCSSARSRIIQTYREFSGEKRQI